MKKRGWGYTPPPKSRAVAMRARAGVAERLDSVAREKAERRAEDNEPLRDAPQRLTLAESTARKRAQLAPGCDLDAQIARDKEAAMSRPSPPQFIQIVMDDLGLSEAAARLYGLALRSVEAPEPRQTSIAMADPVTGRTSDRINLSVTPTGHPMRPDPGWGNYHPGRIPAQAVLGLPPSAPLSPQQRLEAVRIVEAAHLEWESVGILKWTQRGSWGRLRL
jgi:hypothetical protein